jgi:YHS domain-containing protein
MSPIRLIIIGILLYIGYLLIKGSGTKKKEDPPSELHDPGEASDILVEDPVCKKLVPKQQAVTAKDGDETVYFCSKECCNTFVSQKGAE